jgi:hypothetical protein
MRQPLLAQSDNATNPDECLSALAGGGGGASVMYRGLLVRLRA